MRSRKKLIILVLTLSMVVGSSMIAFADGIESSLHWKNEDGSHPTNEWKWVDWDGDGVAEYYYFNENGYVIVGTITPDGYHVNSEGAWVEDGVVQTQAATAEMQWKDAEIVRPEGYDPAHPLANAPESWNLKLTPDKNFLNYDYICGNDNIHAMLTGQMEYYHRREDGMGQTEFQPDLNTREQELYEWYCNWLNSMDFMNMTERERAYAIKDVLVQSEYKPVYVAGDEDRNMDYTVLIRKEGVCTEFAMTATSLATSLGLKSRVDGDAGHSWAYIQVDGKAYQVNNNVLDLNFVFDKKFYD